jgi:hypothetical protein
MYAFGTSISNHHPQNNMGAQKESLTPTSAGTVATETYLRDGGSGEAVMRLQIR